MKLAILLNSYTTGTSGGDVWCVEVAKRLDQFDKTVVTSALGRSTFEKLGLINVHFEITSTEQAFRNLIPTYLVRTIRAVFILKHIRPDILYVGSDFFPDVLPAAIHKLRYRKTTWVQKIYHVIPRQRFASSALQVFSHILIRWLASAVIVDNKKLANHLEEFGIAKKRLTVCRPGIPVNNAIQITRHRSDTTQVALYVGRLHRSKGVHELIELWKLVCNKCPEAHLNIVGEGDHKIKAYLEDLIDKSGLSQNVSLLGYLEDDSVRENFHAATIFVTASKEEGFGMAVLEALANGLPVIAWDIPVFAEAFGDSLVRVPIGNVNEFAEAIVRMFDDMNYWLKYSEAGKEIASEFSWKKTTARELDTILGGTPD